MDDVDVVMINENTVYKSTQNEKKIEQAEPENNRTFKRNMEQAMIVMNKLEKLMNLPKVVIDEAINIYKNAIRSGFMRGRSIEIVAVISIYAACRKLKVPRTLDEIAEYSGFDRVELGKIYRAMIAELKIEIPISDPKDHVERIGRLLQLSDITIEKAMEIIDKAKEMGYPAGKDPAGIAASAIYIAGLLTNERRTQKEIAHVSNVTEVTIRSRYKGLIKITKIKVPPVKS